MSRNKLFGGLTTLLTITILLAIHQGNIQAATGRNSDYSRLAAHGGYANSGGGNTKGVLRTATDLDSYAPGNCAHCHEQHASINSSNGAPSDRLLFATLVGNALCNTCHDSSEANFAKDIDNQITKAYGHDPLVNWGGTADELPTCDKCHNSHEARRFSHEEAVDGNVVDPSTSDPVTSGPLVSVMGQQVTNWGSATPLPGNELFSTIIFAAAPATVTEEWQLCFKCHADDKLPDKIALDVGRQFNPSNHSVHPVTTTGNWNNDYLSGANQNVAFKAPWNNVIYKHAKMYCSDCHGGDDADTTGNQGPHGSTNEFLLKAIAPGVDGNSALDNHCLRCHDVYNPSGSRFADLAGWALPNTDLIVGDHNLADHQYHPVNNPAGCLACHGGIAATLSSLRSDIHGANYTWPAIPGPPFLDLRAVLFISPGGYKTTGAATITDHYYDSTAGATPANGKRYCAATCHIIGQAYRYR